MKRMFLKEVAIIPKKDDIFLEHIIMYLNIGFVYNMRSLSEMVRE